MTIFLTNQTLGFDYRLKNNQENLKINQLVTTIHSMSKLNTNSQVFYIAYDTDLKHYQKLVENFIGQNYSNFKIENYRLETFEQWKRASELVPDDTDFVLLQSNADHAYTLEDAHFFNSFTSELKNLGSRAVGSISHWPESIYKVMNPLSNFKPTLGGNFIVDTTSTIGTCLVSPTLFKEWWQSDFTSGKRIIRPDNVFGPSVTFSKSRMLIPRIEMFRHLDGYGHVNNTEPYASYLRPCCIVVDDTISHEPWRNSRIREWNEYSDLPIFTSEFNTNGLSILEYLTWASSYKSNFRIIKIVRAGFKQKFYVVCILYVIFLLKHPKKWNSVFIDLIVINILIKGLVGVLHLLRKNQDSSNLNDKFSRLVELIHLRGIVYTIKSRIKRKKLH